MKKTVIIVLTLTLVCSLCCAFAACGGPVNVTFDFQNGSDPIVVVFDENFALPEVPENGTQVFVGWYTDKDGSAESKWSQPEELSQSITVYAKWAYTVKFDAQNYEEYVYVVFDENFALPETPVYDLKVFEGWYVDEDCTEEWVIPQTLSSDITVYGKWSPHVHNVPESYFMFAKCATEGCPYTERTPSTNSAKENFVYVFSDKTKKDVDGDYDALIAAIASGSATNDEFEELFLKFDDDLSFVIEQYQYARVFYDVSRKDADKENFDAVSDYYNELVSRYYSLYREIYQSSYKDFFYEDWPEEEIELALKMSDSYGNSEYTALKDSIDALKLDYDDVLEKYESASSSKKGQYKTQLNQLYSQLVEYNNQLATLAGYDNYMDYAYEVVFERDYTPSQVDAMRSNVKQYVTPIADKYAAKFDEVKFSGVTASYTLYLTLCGASVFGNNANSKTAVNYLGNYFATMTSDNYNEPIDFLHEADELFKNGNYYTGKDDGAYSYYIRNQDTTILFFGNKSSNSYYSYQNPFTFVHEFGHYYNNVYNGRLSLSMDHDETQSQGNEMMFLAWLAQYAGLPANASYGFEVTEIQQLVNSFFIIQIATAVDEFEQAVYSGEYKGSDYFDFFSKILADYGTLVNDGSYSDYWSMVAFHSAGYYISYAMSALPCVELYVEAMQNYAAAKEMYLKLFTFSDKIEGDDALCKVDEYGYKSVTATYQEILTYAGLHGPFEDELFEIISKYF